MPQLYRTGSERPDETRNSLMGAFAGAAIIGMIAALFTHIFYKLELQPGQFPPPPGFIPQGSIFGIDTVTFVIGGALIGAIVGFFFGKGSKEKLYSD